MHSIELSEEELKRLKVADETNDWSYLASWKELYLFQRMKSNKSGCREKIIEIGKLAHRSKEGENIILPYKNKALIP